MTAGRTTQLGRMAICLASVAVAAVSIGAVAAQSSAAEPGAAASSTASTATISTAVSRATGSNATGPGTAFTGQDSAAIERLIEDYFHAFTVKDFADFNRYFTAPFVLVGREPRVLPSLQDAIQAWHHIRDPLDHTDYAASKPVHIRVIGLTPQTALANIYWQRLTKSGAVMSQGAEFYFVTKKSGRWQIDGNMGEQLALYRGPR